MKATDIVMQSYGRCCASDGFFDTFYTHFLASSPEVRDKFANTNMAGQKLLLRQGILNVVLYARGMPGTKLKALGCSHSRQGMNIRPELYTLWFNALAATIREHDKESTAETMQAWREVVNKSVEVIVAEY